MQSIQVSVKVENDHQREVQLIWHRPLDGGLKVATPMATIAPGRCRVLRSYYGHSFSVWDGDDELQEWTWTAARRQLYRSSRKLPQTPETGPTPAGRLQPHQSRIRQREEVPEELPGDNEAKDSSEEEDKEDSDDENSVDAKPETASKDAGDAPSKEKRPETPADPAVSVAKLGHPLPPLPSGSAASFCPPGAAVQPFWGAELIAKKALLEVNANTRVQVSRGCGKERWTAMTWGERLYAVKEHLEAQPPAAKRAVRAQAYTVRTQTLSVGGTPSAGRYTGTVMNWATPSSTAGASGTPADAYRWHAASGGTTAEAYRPLPGRFAAREAGRRPDREAERQAGLTKLMFENGRYRPTTLPSSYEKDIYEERVSPTAAAR